MADLTTAERLARFGENEERVQTFVNKTGTYTTTENVTVETLPSFLARKNTEVNTATNSILSQATAAAEAAETYAEAAEAAAGNLSIRKYPASGPLIATAGQTKITPGFTLDTVKDNVAVYIDGVKQARGTYSFTSTTVTLSEALTGVETIEVFSADTTAAGSAPLYQANNLSDIQNLGTALANLSATATPTANALSLADSDGTLNNWTGARYAECKTVSATAAKVADLANFLLAKGSRVFVTFANTNTVSGAITLNINDTGAKSVYNERGVVSSTNAALWTTGIPIEFIYDGNYWWYKTVDGVGNAISQYLYVRDEKPSGTQGGSTSAATWHTRDLNTVKFNGIGASLTSNRVTLPAGTYYVRARTPAYTNGGARAALYDVTHTTYLCYGATCYVNDSYGMQADCLLEDKITLSETTTIELRMYSRLTNTNGLGYVLSPIAGVNEIYSELRIWKM